MKLKINITICFHNLIENSLRLSVFLVCLFSFNITHTQPYNYRFEVYGYNQGLKGTPTCMLQDSQGFIWIGTQYGLYKYDGYYFESFINKPEDATTISNNFVTCIVEDKRHNLWIGTQNGLNKFNIFTKKFIRYFHNPNNISSLSDSYITALYIDNNNTLWIGTQQGGLNKIKLLPDNKQNKLKTNFQKYTYNRQDSFSISHNHVNSILEHPETNNRDIWIATSNGLNIFDKKAKKFIRYFHQANNAKSLPSNGVTSLFVDNKGTMWIGTNDGYISAVNNPNSISFENYNIGNKSAVLDIKEDSYGNLWIGAQVYGLLKFNKLSKTFIRLPSSLKQAGYLLDDDIWNIMFDNRQRIWVATRFGLHKSDPNDKRFYYYPLDPPKNLWVLWPFGFCRDNNNELWVATFGNGLYRFKTISSNPINYLPQENNPKSLCSRWITQIVCTREGTIWIGTNKGLDRYKPSTNSFIHYKGKYPDDNPSFLTNGFINTLYVDSKDNLWIGSAGGLSKYNKKKKLFEHYLNDKYQLNKIGFYIGAIYEDHKGKFWIGANSLYQFDPKKNIVSKYFNIVTGKQSSIECMVFSILEDDNFNIWVGTYKGLFRLGIDGSLKHFTEKDGLPSNITYGLLKDDDGFLWIETFKGMIKFNPKDYTYKRYYFHGNFLQDEFAIKGFYKDKDGKFFLGQAQRFTFFYPDEIKDNSNLIPVFFTKIKISDNIIKFNKPISEVEAIKLSYKENRINIGWVGLTYTNNKKIKYAYKLEGFNEGWVNCNYEREATFTNMDPGEYTFRVKASNDDGIWNKNASSIKFIISAPFYQTWWFHLITTIIFIIVLFAINKRLRTQREQQQQFSQKLIESQEEERKRIAGELHDGLGQNLIIIYNEIQQFLRRTGKIPKELENLAPEVKETIEEVREIARNLHPHQLEQLGLTKAIQSIIKKVSRSTKINFQSNIEYIDRFLPPGLWIHIYRIMQEALTNIVKHSSATEVLIKIKKEQENIILLIQDNGRGFDFEEIKKADAEKGFGLKNLKERARLLGAKFEFSSPLQKGVKILITIPIHSGN